MTGNGHLGLAAGVVARLGGPGQPRPPQPPSCDPSWSRACGLGRLHVPSVSAATCRRSPPARAALGGTGVRSAWRSHLTPHPRGSRKQSSPHPSTAGTRSGGALGVLPSSFFFASSNPNWGSDSRTLHGRKEQVSPPGSASARCPLGISGRDTDAGAQLYEATSTGPGPWEHQPQVHTPSPQAPSGEGGAAPLPRSLCCLLVAGPGAGLLRVTHPRQQRGLEP